MLGLQPDRGIAIAHACGARVSTLLPLLGVQRPLDPIPLVVLGDILTVSLYLFRRKHPAKLAWRAQIETISREESRLLVASGFCVALAILGANRLNNGAGDQVSVAALGGMVVTLLLLLRWQQHVRDGMTGATLYLLSLALLLMTSLRGWSVTGHDIQMEYRVFQLTEAQGRWSISAFHNPYNACLSITVLPTEWLRSCMSVILMCTRRSFSFSLLCAQCSSMQSPGVIGRDRFLFWLQSTS